MKGTKLLWMIIGILTLINVGILTFIVLGPNPHPEKKFDNMIIHELELNNEQIRQFNILKENHHRQIVAIDHEMKETFAEYFNLLTVQNNLLKKDSLEKILSEKYKQKVQITYQHFNDLKGICTEDQRKKMHGIIPMLMQVINPQKTRTDHEGIK
jgi:protein CpxP